MYLVPWGCGRGSCLPSPRGPQPCTCSQLKAVRLELPTSQAARQGPVACPCWLWLRGGEDPVTFSGLSTLPHGISCLCRPGHLTRALSKNALKLTLPQSNFGWPRFTTFIFLKLCTNTGKVCVSALVFPSFFLPSFSFPPSLLLLPSVPSLLPSVPPSLWNLKNINFRLFFYYHEIYYISTDFKTSFILTNTHSMALSKTLHLVLWKFPTYKN